MTPSRLLSLFWACLGLACPAPLSAHTLPLEVVVYVAADSSSVRVLARVPAALLSEARLPLGDDGYLDAAGIDGPMKGVATYVARTLDVMEHGRPLAPTSSTWSIALAGDTSFDRYESAQSRVAGARAMPSSSVDPATALVDLAFVYPRPGGGPLPAPLSLRVNDFRGPRPAEMRVVVVDPSGDTRTIVSTGAPRRVELHPGWREVAAMFSRLGIRQFTLATELMLFVLCLAVPRRSLSDALSGFAVFAAGWSIALAAAAVAPGTLGLTSAPVVQICLAAGLVVVALQNIVEPRRVWVAGAAIGFGLCSGWLMGTAYRTGAPLAGAHGFVALAAFAAPIVAGALWLLLVAKPAVGLVRRTPLPERWATVLASAIAAHAGLHGLIGSAS